MIAFLRGSVLRKTNSYIVLDVNGVGYQVNVLPQVALDATLGQRLELNTIQIFREDSQALYGFIDSEELDVFNLLCSVNGVGPRSALGIVGQMGVSGVQAAVSSADDSAFKTVSGVGPKTAKLIVLTLTGKLVTPEASGVSSEVLTALINLGYQEKVAAKAINEVSVKANSDAELLKLSLSALANSRRVTADE